MSFEEILHSVEELLDQGDIMESTMKETVQIETGGNTWEPERNEEKEEEEEEYVQLKKKRFRPTYQEARAYDRRPEEVKAAEKRARNKRKRENRKKREREQKEVEKKEEEKEIILQVPGPSGMREVQARFLGQPKDEIGWEARKVYVKAREEAARKRRKLVRIGGKN